MGEVVLAALRARLIEARLEDSLAQQRLEPIGEDVCGDPEILLQVARGRSSKEIARDCRISSKTVGNHVNNLYQKLQLSHRGELVLYAAGAGLTGCS